MGNWIGQIYEAMNAKAFKKDDPKLQEKISRIMSNNNYIAQRKLNGERIMVYKHNGAVRLVGRNNSKYGNRMEKTGLLPHIVQEIAEKFPFDCMLDGEIVFIPDEKNKSMCDIKSFNFKEDFWKCREIMAHHVYPKEGVALQEQIGKLHYIVFDILAFQDKELILNAYSERLELLESLNDDYFQHFHYMHYLPVSRGTAAKNLLREQSVVMGLEGIMLKQLSATYKVGDRPANVWVKLKRFDPADCIVIGYTTADRFTEITRNGKKVVGPNGKVLLAESRFYLSGWIGAMWLGQWSINQPTAQQIKNAKSFFFQIIEQKFGGVTRWLVPVAKVSGMDDNTRALISEHKDDFLGKICVINYFDQTRDAYFQPTFQFFRDDKSMLECLWDFNDNGTDIENEEGV